MFIKKFIEQAFEFSLKALAGISNIGNTAKTLKVSVKVQNLVETNTPLRKLSILSENIWLDLLEDKKRCQLEGLAINAVPDLLITIKSTEKGLAIGIESKYFKKEDPESEIGKAFKEFIDDANEIIDETFGRDRSLVIEASVAEATKTKQMLKLNEFFETKINKMFFAVLVKKFVAEIGK